MSFILIMLSAPLANSEIVEEIITLPVLVKNIYGGEFKQEIVVTIFRENSRAKSPWLVLNHGRPSSGALQMGRQRYSQNSKYFVEKGFLVLVPTRVGYGPSGGPDVEYSGGVWS
jgi:pimeloyl-ACP methyl ester carboxylesterase